jgi:hypothetical protein
MCPRQLREKNFIDVVKQALANIGMRAGVFAGAASDIRHARVVGSG